MGRLRALDALRGVLAATIVLHHVLGAWGWPVLAPIAWWIVAAFWAMSGYVLALGYDGHPIVFMVRRMVRLWPVYGVCVAGTALLAQRLPPLDELLWSPLPLARGALTLTDPPSWSLFVEAYATPFLPVAFWLVRRRLGAVALLAIGVATAAWVPAVLCFAIGVAGTRLPIAWPQRVPMPLVWLGRVSYPLYLIHFPVIAACAAVFGAPGPLLALIGIPGITWALWRWVEVPSVDWSRRIAAWMIRLAAERRARQGFRVGLAD